MLKIVVIVTLVCISSALGYYSTKFPSQCDEDINAPYGSIQSPGYPNIYRNFLDCSYLITTSANTDVTLTFADFFLEPRFDYVIIYDGPSNNSTCLGKFSGMESNISLYASTNQVLVWFHTDIDSEYRGFNITFQERVRCGEVLSGTYGSILSPGYPTFPYPNNRDCLYKVTTSPGTFVTYDIVSMSLEPNNDYVEIYNIPYTGHFYPPKDTYTGEQTRVIKQTMTNYMTVHFHSDGSGRYPGFIINFREMEETNCPAAVYKSNDGVISSPYYPYAPYPSDSDCSYLIYTTTYNAQLALKFSYLNISVTNDCDEDYVELFDGPKTSDQRLARVCGGGPVPLIVSKSNAVLVHFHSDNVTQEEYGFEINYNISACTSPLNVSGEYGTISSPGYPLSNYPNYANCVYLIETPAGSQVLLHINFLKVEYGASDCQYDNIIIYEGFESPPQHLIVKLCGEMNDVDFQSTTNKVRLEFNSDHSINDRGVSITYTAVYNRG